MTSGLAFGLVGCGRIGKRYADLLSSGSTVGGRHVAVCGIAPGRVAALPQAYRSPDTPRGRRQESAAKLAAIREIIIGAFNAEVNDLNLIERLPTLPVP